ncbi:MAG: hypothetical protein K0R08_9 [Solimicrobium sp.]|jgi:hypothetical protein|nr:hypothetical protein [Solimicrobium sp.]
MENEINNNIQELAAAQCQVRPLKSLKESARCAEQATTREIRHLFQQNMRMIKEGLNVFSRECDGFVAHFSEKLLGHLHSAEEVIKIIDSDIQKNEHAMELFLKAADSFYDSGNIYIEQCVLCVLLMLFPLHPQSYARYAILISRKESITVAESLYTHLVDSLEDPVLDYFTADCWLKSGHQIEAKKLIERATAKTQTLLQEQQVLQKHLFNLSRLSN